LLAVPAARSRLEMRPSRGRTGRRSPSPVDHASPSHRPRPRRRQRRCPRPVARSLSLHDGARCHRRRVRKARCDVQGQHLPRTASEDALRSFRGPAKGILAYTRGCRAEASHGETFSALGSANPPAPRCRSSRQDVEEPRTTRVAGESSRAHSIGQATEQKAELDVGWIGGWRPLCSVRLGSELRRARARARGRARPQARDGQARHLPDARPVLHGVGIRVA
jgi:hypothetical protein